MDRRAAALDLPARACARDDARQIEDWTLDQQGGDREIDWVRRHLQRHGLALTPPADWVSPRESYEAQQAAKAAAAKKVTFTARNAT